MNEPLPVTCPACGSADTSPVLEARDYTVTGETFIIRECRSCTLRFTWPVPDAGQIGRYYQSEDYISHSDTQAGLINKLYHYVRKISLGRKKKWIIRYTGRAGGHILDIGCGTGYFLKEMQSAGWQVTGLEPDEKARALGLKERQIEALPPEELFRLPPASFHAITLWHVLEHVHDLHGYLHRIRELLIPGGALLIAVPNYTSRDQRLFGAHWAAYDVPRHLYHFSPKALEKLAARHGLRTERLKAMPFDAFYISLLSEKYAHGSARYLRGLLTGLGCWIRATRDVSEASSILYILRSA